MCRLVVVYYLTSSIVYILCKLSSARLGSVGSFCDALNPRLLDVFVHYRRLKESRVFVERLRDVSDPQFASLSLLLTPSPLLPTLAAPLSSLTASLHEQPPLAVSHRQRCHPRDGGSWTPFMTQFMPFVCMFDIIR